jgi:predicted alpha/beta superfamily hydrolase
LLEKGTHVNAQQNKGISALHMAVDHFDISVVKMLLDYGANPLLSDDQGVSPLQLAENKQFLDIVDIIKRKLSHEQHIQSNPIKGQLQFLHNFYMPELNDFRTIRIYLPPGYESNEDIHYPVLYMHDGQNLFETQTSSFGMIWDVALTIEQLIEEGVTSGIIVVGIDNNQNGHGRFNEYSPWKSEVVKELLNNRIEPHEEVGGQGFAYLDFIVHTLKPHIDKYYRTQTGKESTYIGGSSMGGYISIAAAFAYPQVFSRILACSTAVFFEEQQLLDYIRTSEKPTQQKIYMDIGTNETSNADNDSFEQLYVESNQRLLQCLREIGFVDEQSVRFIIEEGAEHNELAWARRLPAALKWLLR